MPNTFNRGMRFARTHRIWSIVIVIIVAGIGYWAYGKYTAVDAPTQYVLAEVERGNIVTVVTGTGQVAVSDQVDIKPRVSGALSSINVAQGQAVRAGVVLARIDATNAQKTVRDAQANLRSAQISFEKLVQPADKLSLIQAQNSIASANESKANAQQDLQKAYDDGFNEISNTFLDLPAVMSGLDDLLHGYTRGLGSAGEANIDFYTRAIDAYSDQGDVNRTDTNNKYAIARTAYDQNFTDYKSLNRTADVATISRVIDETYVTTKDISDAVKSANDLIQFYEDQLITHGLTPASVADVQLSTLNGFTSKVNGHLNNLLSVKTTIEHSLNAITSADRTLSANTASMEQLTAGADPLDVETSKLTITQRENALADAQAALTDYTLRVPFDGVIAQVNVKKSDDVSTGTVLATIVSPDQMASITLNEVDAAKVAVGQKATLAFDALPDLMITGTVSHIDTIGTVSQGVVNYTVKIHFDTQHASVKPGMTVSASIVTNIVQDVLMLPSSAVKSQGTTSYVEMLDPIVLAEPGAQGMTSPNAPQRQAVQIGTSNDTHTEIVSGLNEGDQVITRTVNSTTGAASSTAPSLLSSFGRSGGGAGTGATRVIPRG